VPFWKSKKRFSLISFLGLAQTAKVVLRGANEKQASFAFVLGVGLLAVCGSVLAHTEVRRTRTGILNSSKQR